MKRTYRGDIFEVDCQQGEVVGRCHKPTHVFGASIQRGKAYTLYECELGHRFGLHEPNGDMGKAARNQRIEELRQSSSDAPAWVDDRVVLDLPGVRAEPPTFGEKSSGLR